MIFRSMFHISETIWISRLNQLGRADFSLLFPTPYAEDFSHIEKHGVLQILGISTSKYSR